MNQSFRIMNRFLCTSEKYKNEDLAEKILITKDEELQHLNLSEFFLRCQTEMYEKKEVSEFNKTMIKRIYNECKTNIWYFFREILKVGTIPMVRSFNLKLMELAIIDSYTKNKSFILIKRHNSVSSSMELLSSLTLYNMLFNDEIKEANDSLFIDLNINQNFISEGIENAIRGNEKFLSILEYYGLSNGNYSMKKISAEHVMDEDIKKAKLVVSDDNTRKFLEPDMVFLLKEICESSSPFMLKIIESLVDNIRVYDNKGRMFSEILSNYDNIQINSIVDLSTHPLKEYENAVFVLVHITREEHTIYQRFINEFNEYTRMICD